MILPVVYLALIEWENRTPPEHHLDYFPCGEYIDNIDDSSMSSLIKQSCSLEKREEKMQHRCNNEEI